MIQFNNKAVCRFRNCTLFLFVLVGATAFAQLRQPVYGTVTDVVSRPLAGANIQLIRSDSAFLTVSGNDGKFTISVVPGRYLVRATFTGFSNFDEELLVIAGKTNALKIVLQESSQQLSDVEVINRTASEIPGSYSISIEKTMRIPANFFDPVRMAASLPGVVATNDQGNSISIKGYSPNAMLWRLQGLDIVNPNHLANAGTLSDRPVANGGGVSILSSQVLDRTNFYSGSLPVQYGNALSGAMDMSLRPGSKTTREHTVQASLIGIDLATEGPMSKRNESGEANASYLVNYRYSTVGLLSQLGVNFGDEAINFQDLTFNLDFNHRKGGNLSVFGFGGLSSNRFDRKPEDDWEFEKDRYNIDFTGQVFGLGFLNTSKPGNNSELKFGVSASAQFQERESVSGLFADPHIESEYFKSNRSLISSLLNYQNRVSPLFSWTTGAVVTSFMQEMKSQTVLSDPISIMPNPNGSVNGVLWQPYFNTEFDFRSWHISTGFRYVHFTFNKSRSFEPRMSIHRSIKNGQLYLNYGITSQMQQASAYLLGGSDVGLNKAHQVSLGYSGMVRNGLQLSVQVYYHQLYNIAGFQTSSVPFSVLNYMEEWIAFDLKSDGQGRNYGAEATLEKKFTNKIYFLATGSYYQSEFSDKTGKYYPSRFNGNFTSSLTGGKEWARSNKVFGIHVRTLYLGGLRQSAIDAGESPTYGYTVYDNEKEFPEKLPNYFRLDLRASWRKNKPGYTRTISIDIQNVTAQQNLAYRYFDTYLQRVSEKNQLGLIPVLVYRIDF